MRANEDLRRVVRDLVSALVLDERAAPSEESQAYEAELAEHLGHDEGVEAAQQRIFSEPAPSTETEICSEWKVYVEPELRRLFRSASETAPRSASTDSRIFF